MVELSLSVDNLFVFLSLFGSSPVPPEYGHKVLFWGILGAMITRGGFILAGVAIVTRFHSVIYLLGAFLIWTGYKMAVSTETDVHPFKNPIVEVLPSPLAGDAPATGEVGSSSDAADWRSPRRWSVLLAVETTDVMFAVDSVPAVFAVTRNPFIAYSSNVLAVPGLRAMFFVVAGFIERFRYLHYGLAACWSSWEPEMLLEELAPDFDASIAPGGGEPSHLVDSLRRYASPRNRSWRMTDGMKSILDLLAKRRRRVVGLMSGTSADGVDAALSRDREPRGSRGAWS